MHSGHTVLAGIFQCQ